MRRLELEISEAKKNVKRLLLTALGFALCGIVVWCSTDGIFITWRLLVKPPLTCPLVILFVLWSTVYFLYGLIFAINLSDNTTLVKITMSYLLALFWCPLALSAVSKISAVTALLVSLLYLGLFLKRCRRTQTLTIISAVFIGLVLAYSLYITVGIC